MISYSFGNCRCAGPETIAALKDGQEIVVKRKLHRGNYVASAGAGKFFLLFESRATMFRDVGAYVYVYFSSQLCFIAHEILEYLQTTQSRYGMLALQ